MTKRGAVEFVPDISPLGHEFIHKAHKVSIVRGFQQMDHLMDSNIFKAFARLLGKLRVEPDGAPAGRATPPARSSSVLTVQCFQVPVMKANQDQRIWK